MNSKKTKKQAIIDLIIIFACSVIPMIIYLFLGQYWRSLSQSDSVNFWVKFLIQCFLSFCLAGLGFVVVMILRKEDFAKFGLVRKNIVGSIILSSLTFVPHFIFLMVTRGFHGYVPMSGAIVFDSVMLQSLFEKIICVIILFAIWGFCEGFSILYIGQKINSIWKPKTKFLNIGAIVSAIIFVFMHGGVSLDPVVLFDAITMFVFIYGILVIKDITGNAWGCIFSFFFLWNAFPA